MCIESEAHSVIIADTRRDDLEVSAVSEEIERLTLVALRKNSMNIRMIPIPVAIDLAELNAKLLADCRLDESRILAGRTQSVGTLLLTEKEYLLPLPVEGFELAEVSYPRVDQAGCRC